MEKGVSVLGMGRDKGDGRKGRRREGKGREIKDRVG